MANSRFGRCRGQTCSAPAASDTLTVGRRIPGRRARRSHGLASCARMLRGGVGGENSCEAWFEIDGAGGASEPESESHGAGAAAAVPGSGCTGSPAATEPSPVGSWPGPSGPAAAPAPSPRHRVPPPARRISNPLHSRSNRPHPPGMTIQTAPPEVPPAGEGFEQTSDRVSPKCELRRSPGHGEGLEGTTGGGPHVPGLQSV